jgi:hypothetical protein
MKYPIFDLTFQELSPHNPKFIIRIAYYLVSGTLKYFGIQSEDCCFRLFISERIYLIFPQLKDIFRPKSNINQKLEIFIMKRLVSFPEVLYSIFEGKYIDIRLIHISDKMGSDTLPVNLCREISSCRLFYFLKYSFIPFPNSTNLMENMNEPWQNP